MASICSPAHITEPRTRRGYRLKMSALEPKVAVKDVNFGVDEKVSNRPIPVGSYFGRERKGGMNCWV